jgi:hypothetical protein
MADDDDDDDDGDGNNRQATDVSLTHTLPSQRQAERTITKPDSRR